MKTSLRTTALFETGLNMMKMSTNMNITSYTLIGCQEIRMGGGA